MTQRYQIYKCKVCGGKLEVFVHGGDNLVCCGEKMELLENKRKKLVTKSMFKLWKKQITG